MGYVVFWVSGLIMFVFEVYWFFQWWDVGGVIVSFVVPPLAALFPFIYLFQEGFSLLYFGIWAVGLLAMFAQGAAEA